MGRCPLSIFCSRGTPSTVEPTNPESITGPNPNPVDAVDKDVTVKNPVRAHTLIYVRMLVYLVIYVYG